MAFSFALIVPRTLSFHQQDSYNLVRRKHSLGNTTLKALVCFRALFSCSRGYDFFGGCNLLLQEWVMEDAPQLLINCVVRANRSCTHYERMGHWNASNNVEEWYHFLTRRGRPHPIEIVPHVQEITRKSTTKYISLS